MGALDGIFSFPARQRLAAVGHVVVGALAVFSNAAGKIAASLVTVDDSGNVTTPGAVTAGNADIREEGGAAAFGYGGLAAAHKAVRQFASGETSVASKNALSLVGDADEIDPTYAYLADGMQVYRGSAAGEPAEPSAVLQVGAGPGKYGGFLPPRVTSANRPASPATGLILYNTTAARLEMWDGAAWVGISTVP